MSDPPTSPLRLSKPPTEDLVEAVEEIRAADHAAVPADLLAAVLTAEREGLDDRLAATRAVGRIVDAWLTEHPVDSEVAAPPGDTPQGAPAGPARADAFPTLDEEDRS